MVENNTIDAYDDNIIEEYDDIIFNICRIMFYVPIIFFGSVIVSITYDYITFKEDNNENKKLD
uniref:Uncharacterized protein n=1 Tax=viral metagenome TaxID=1070528 RepID=A0A6C0C5C0_9ZZZZ